MPVEQVEKDLFTSESRRVDAEFRRLDSEVAGVTKSQEKFETKTEKAINDVRMDVGALRAEMNTRFEKLEKGVDARFEKLEKGVDARFEKLEKGVDARFEKLEKGVNDRFEKLENSVNDRFDSVDARFDSVNARFDRMDERFDRMDARFDKVDEKANGNFKAIVTIYLSMTGLVLAAFYAFVSYMAK
jgi:chaperonin cofactor prefoldin